MNRTTRAPFSRSTPIAPQGTSDVTGHEFYVDSIRPLVSVIARITPSPDWFIGVHDLDLCDRTSGLWLKVKQVQPVYSYDAVTSSGISRIYDHPSAPWTNQKRQLGIFHFSRMSESGGTTTGKFESDETVKCPNKASLSNMSRLIICLTLFVVSINSQ